jgi:hypothetical protein
VQASKSEQYNEPSRHRHKTTPPHMPKIVVRIKADARCSDPTSPVPARPVL